MSEEEFKRLHLCTFDQDPTIMMLVELLMNGDRDKITELKRSGAIEHRDLVIARQIIMTALEDIYDHKSTSPTQMG